MKTIVRFIICLMISLTLVEIPMMKSAHAEMISTHVVVDNMSRIQTQQKIIEFMGTSEVQNHLIKLGVSPEEASARVAHLSDNELRQIAGDIDHSVAGGEVGGILGIILIVLLIIFLARRI
jgi:hypothetical protein